MTPTELASLEASRSRFNALHMAISLLETQMRPRPSVLTLSKTGKIEKRVRDELCTRLRAILATAGDLEEE